MKRKKRDWPDDYFTIDQLTPQNRAIFQELADLKGEPIEKVLNDWLCSEAFQQCLRDELDELWKQLEGTVHGKLWDWRESANIGRRPATQKFNTEILHTITDNWPTPQLAKQNKWESIKLQRAADVTEKMVVEFAKHVEHYCHSRWNGIVTALRYVTPEAYKLNRKPVRFRHFVPPTKEQMNTLLAELDKAQRGYAGLIVRFLCLTGLRINEARQLKWSDVHDDRIEIVAENSKNGRRRSVPLLEGTRELLSKLREAGTTDSVLPYAECRTAIRYACKRAGIPMMSYHCYRHLFATRCIESGVDVPTVARWIGHSDGGALLSKMYFHLLDDHSRTMAKKARIF